MFSSNRPLAGKDFISQLPEDIILLIAVHLSVQDVFSLKQASTEASRRLNRVTDSDYLWHKLLPSEDLPLNLSPFCDVRSLNALELRASALRALKLQRNWAAKCPRVRSLFVLNQNSGSGSFDELRLLCGGRHLIGIRRERYAQRPTTCVFVYTLDSERSFQSANLMITANMRDFDAFIDPDNGNLLLASTAFRSDSEFLDVYSVKLPSSAANLKTTTYSTEYSFLLRQGGVFHKVSLHDSFMAASIINPLQAEGGIIAQILIVNWKTKQQFTISPRFENVFDQVDVKVLPPYLAIFSASADSVQVTLVPLSVIARGDIMEVPSHSRAKLTQYPLPPFPTSIVRLLDTYDICISSNTGYGPYVPPTSISIIYFPSLSRLESRQCKKALHLRFEVSGIPKYDRASSIALASSLSSPTICAMTSSEHPNSTSISNEELLANTPGIALHSSNNFDIPVGSYPEHAQLGSTGRRAVWLEQSLKSDYVQLLRLDFDPVAARENVQHQQQDYVPPASSSGGFGVVRGLVSGSVAGIGSGTTRTPRVDVLLPPEPQLPFKPSSCRSLAFDEATGRLCIGLYNGAIFILDYV